MRLISHRAKGFGRENTLDAFERAICAGVEMIEIDVRMTLDGVAVIHHDPAISGKRISKTKFLDLHIAAPWIPSLRSTLNLMKDRCKINLEVKEGHIGTIAEELLNGTRPENVILTSFDQSFVREFKSMNPLYETGFLALRRLNPIRTASRMVSSGIGKLFMHHILVNRKIINEMNRNGIDVYTWTVNDGWKAVKLIEMGVSGIITDEYLSLSSVISEHGAPCRF